MTSIHVTVPLVFWGRHPPVHDITCIARTDEEKGVATGSKSGQICIWDLYRKKNSKDFVLCPRLLLLGVESAVTSLSFVRNWSGDRDRIVSLAKNGTISLWDGKDGTCLKTNNSLGTGKHSGIKAIARDSIKETLIAVWGEYSSVFILDSNTLELICALKSSHNPNWISEICFIPNNEKNDAMIAITVDGTLKLWFLHSNIEMKEMCDLFEEKSKALGVTRPLAIASQSIGNCCIALVVCKDYWQLYDASDGRMKMVLMRACEKNVTEWMSGSFLTYNMLIMWSSTGEGYLYELETSVLPGVIADHMDDSSTAGCKIQAILSPTPSLSSSPLSSLSQPYATFLSHKWHILGDQHGRLQVWHIDTVIRELGIRGEEEEEESADNIPSFDCHLSGALSDSWKNPASPCSLIDALYSDDCSNLPNITCSLFLTKFGRLICGLSNGDIVVLSATQAATKLLLHKRKFSRAWPQHYFLRGHTRRVTSLLHPSDYTIAYDSNYLLSGGADFSVRLWDLYKGTLLHTFAVHGGVVTKIVTCPSDINPRFQTCVCSIAEDHSVAILSTSQNKCLLLASCHTSPVVSVHWRIEEDFLLVNCVGGGLYVWQIETGTLDRFIDGEAAKIILDHTPITNKPHPSASGTSPIQVRSLSLGHEHSLIQILLFDPQYLITRLQKMERVVSKPRPQNDVSKARAFRGYISARRNFSVSEGSSSPSSRISPANTRKSSDASPLFQAKALERIGEAVAANKREVIQPEPPDMTINIARLLVSCLHAWNLDPLLDKECEESLGLVRPSRAVSFGLLSRSGCLSLVLPGWGLVTEENNNDNKTMEVSPGIHKDDLTILKQLSDTKSIPIKDRSHTVGVPQEIYNEKKKEEKRKERDNNITEEIPSTGLAKKEEEEREEEEEGISSELLYHVRWQLSRSLTTQHLLTVVSITNTLMNQSSGAHALASSSGIRRVASESTESEGSSDDEDQHTLKDNLIRATWSRVAALHCVMLPERMAGYFRPPHLPVLASRFMDPTQAIREAAQALLQSELRRVGISGRLSLVSVWSSKLVPPNTAAQLMKPTSRSDDVDYYDNSTNTQATPTQQQQMTALVILGMIGAEFNTESKSSGPPRRKGSRKKVESMPPGSSVGDQFEILDPQVARQTAKTLQAVLLEKPPNKTTLYSSMRCSAVELIGRGFHLWENYVDVPAVLMGLLDLAVHPSFTTIQPTDEKGSKKLRAGKFLSDTARRALNLMVLLRPVTVVNSLAKELSLYLGSQHGGSSPFPHSSLPPLQVGQTPPPNTPGVVTPAHILLPAAKEDMLEMIRTILDKCTTHVSSQILEIVNIVLFCLDQEELKKKSFHELFPSLTRLPSVSYCLKTRRLAVGARTGQVGLYDLKQRKTQMVNAHNHQVTVLSFSEDGKSLATYSYGDSMLRVWHITTSFLSNVISSAPKCVHSWPAISSSSPPSHSNYVRLEWGSNKSIVLYMPDGMEYKYST